MSKLVSELNRFARALIPNCPEFVLGASSAAGRDCGHQDRPLDSAY